jgi:predicted CXXCH cytochrome family protein
MPESSRENSLSDKQIGQKYALDYYRRPRATRLWKRPWNWLTLLFSLLCVAAIYCWYLDASFYAGPIASAHVAAEASCRDCHDRAWQPFWRLTAADDQLHSVSDRACRECHVVADHHATLDMASTACASCHQEHRGERTLVEIADDFCVACHADLTAVKQNKNRFAPHIEHFAAAQNAHPEFALLRTEAASPPADDRLWQVAVYDAAAGKWRDHGGLLFNHKVHLAKEGVLGADREQVQLHCADCHREDASGEYIAPIHYETHCAHCHRLRLRDDVGEVPHERPELIRGVLRESFSASLVEQPANTSPLPSPLRLNLDQQKSVQALVEQAEHAVFGLEAKGMCRKCHFLAAEGNDWRVLDVPPELAALRPDDSPTEMVPQRWFAVGRFNHSQHRAVECTECHQAQESASTADVLLPSIETCRRCHGAGQGTIAAGVADRCTLCHNFHTEPIPLPTATSLETALETALFE